MKQRLFRQVGGGHPVNTAAKARQDFVSNKKVNGEPVRTVKDEGDVFMFTHLRLEVWETLARKCFTNAT